MVDPVVRAHETEKFNAQSISPHPCGRTDRITLAGNQLLAETHGGHATPTDDEYLIIGLIVVALINAWLLYRIHADMRELLEVNKKWAHPAPAETDLWNGEIDAVIDRCLKDIAEHPQHP